MTSPAEKEELVKMLPIEGLEVRDGDLVLGGLPLARWHEAVKVQLAMDIAKLSAGKLGLIIVDGLERLDGATFEAFVNFVLEDECGCQYLVTRVTDDPELTVTTS